MFKVRGSQCGWNVVVKGKSKTKASGREHRGPDYKGFGKAEQGILSEGKPFIHFRQNQILLKAL